MEYKVGQRIEIIEEMYDFYEEGSQGIISEIDDDGELWIEFDTGMYLTFHGMKNWCANVRRVKLTEEEVMTNE